MPDIQAIIDQMTLEEKATRFGDFRRRRRQRSPVMPLD
jgi:hypothetical protein